MWTYNDNELYHYGVLGMKWGVRKQQPAPPAWASKSTIQSQKNLSKSKIYRNRANNAKEGSFKQRRYLEKADKYEKRYKKKANKALFNSSLEAMNAVNKQASVLEKRSKYTNKMANASPRQQARYAKKINKLNEQERANKKAFDNSMNNIQATRVAVGRGAALRILGNAVAHNTVNDTQGVIKNYREVHNKVFDRNSRTADYILYKYYPRPQYYDKPGNWRRRTAELRRQVEI